MSGDKASHPEISVIVPVYKGVRFLGEALGSLRGQSFRDWECICVDDGSKDGSGELAEEIAAEDPRIRVIHQSNGGTSVARNAALGVATGEYVAFLDEDDVYHPRMLETLLAAAKKTDADVVGCEVLWMRNETDHPDFTKCPVPDEREWRTAERADLAQWMSRLYDGVPFEIWRNLYRREVIASHLFVPGIRVEQDLMWNYTLLPRIRRYVKVPLVGYAWRATAAGGFLHPDPESLVSLTRTYRLLADKVASEMGLDEGLRRQLARNISHELARNVWRPLHRGVRLDAESSARLRRGLRDLHAFGVDLRSELELKKRLKWDAFMLTGWDWWARV